MFKRIKDGETIRINATSDVKLVNSGKGRALLLIEKVGHQEEKPSAELTEQTDSA